MSGIRVRSELQRSLLLAALFALPGCASPPPPASAPLPAARPGLFLATVNGIEYAPRARSDRNWVVYTTVDRVLAGDSPGSIFTFRVHSPTMEGIETGARYRIKAAPAGTGYRVESIEREGTQGGGAPSRPQRAPRRGGATEIGPPD